jgi:beta-lactam-binding protein with PASTA domain
MPVRRRTPDSGETTQVIDEPTAPLPSATEPPPPGAPIEEPPPERDLWPWLVVLLVLVIAALVGAWLASRHNSGRPAQTTAAPIQTIAPAPGARAVGRVTVPRVVGLQTPAALTALRRAGLTGTTRAVFSAKPANRVVAQSPAAAAKVARGATVTLEVSKGQKPVAVPDVTGQQVAAALATLGAQGLRANVVRVPSDGPAGQVLAQHPKAGATAPPGSSVRLNVAAGSSSGGTTSTSPASPPPPPAAAAVTVPDVRGEKVNDARKRLREAGLVLEIRKVPSSLPKNSVVAQSPRPDTAARQGDHVLVTVSRGRAKGKQDAGAVPAAAAASIPDVTGEDEATATQDLEAAGFDVRAVDQETTDESEDGLVVGQDPSPGREAPAGSRATIYVGRFGG